MGYYNKIAEIKSKEYLSEYTYSLIILNVTGDTNYSNQDLEDLYQNLYIVHLLVLSGSNLHILNGFFTIMLKRDNIRLFVITKLALLVYICYVYYLHPLSRAYIFTLINDFINEFGLKFHKLIVIKITLIVSIIFYISLNYSKSFLLSLLFAFVILLYDYFCHIMDVSKSSFLSRFLIFPIFLSISSLPIYLIFFNLPNFRILLLSNLLIVPFYDIVSFSSYLLYFLLLLPINPNLYINVLSLPIQYFYKYIHFLYYDLRLYNI